MSQRIQTTISDYVNERLEEMAKYKGTTRSEEACLILEWVCTGADFDARLEIAKKKCSESILTQEDGSDT